MRPLNPIRKPGILVPLLLLAGALLEIVLSWRGVARVHLLAACSRRFERRSTTQSTSILILGDSTGVGVGANLPEESIAGLLASTLPSTAFTRTAAATATAMPLRARRWARCPPCEAMQPEGALR